MSKVEVNQVTQQCGTTLTVGGGACKTTVVDATTVTLGRCGGTVSLASGATQSGFGRTGTVDWQTGSIKTGTFTAVTGEGYFVNTSGGTSIVNLPAGAAGSIVGISDYTRTFNSNNCTVAPNGAEKVGGIAGDVKLDVNGQSATFVYVDGTEGWINIQETQTSQTGLTGFIMATGGTITCCGNCKMHTFTGPGTFTVNATSNCAANDAVSYMVVAGGGGGGVGYRAGGGGAGGFRELSTPVAPYTASPLDGYPTPGNRITVTATDYPIDVGGGGAGGTFPSQTAAVNGSNSIFSTITSAGGGFAGSNQPPVPGHVPGGDGGSGGGGAANSGVPSAAGGTGNTPPTTPAQGFTGGNGIYPSSGGGGGGATTVGANGSSPGVGGVGGTGATTEIPTSPVAYAGGGGGGNCSGGPGTGGVGGAGGGGNGGPNASPFAGTAGSPNTGGGAGGSGGNDTAAGALGGSGIVVIRYKFQ